MKKGTARILQWLQPVHNKRPDQIPKWMKAVSDELGAWDHPLCLTVDSVFGDDNHKCKV
jgi:hypothetical protein